MRLFVGTHLLKVAGRPVYAGLSGRVHFAHGGLIPVAFLIGFFAVPLILVCMHR